MGLKSLLKRILPLPAKRTGEEFSSLRQRLDALDSVDGRLKALEASLAERETRIFRYVQDCVWANVFNNTIVGCKWLSNPDFTPGRAAVGYSYLYVMFRVLNACRPRNILDIGLGQTSKMFAQYAAAHPDVTHTIVESDRNWADFFSKSYRLSSGSRFVFLDYAMESYKGVQDVRTYRHFKQSLSDRKYDFISVDAPFSCDMTQFARIDVLSLIPEHLAEEFVIMVDDTERPADNATVGEIRAALDAAGIANVVAVYGGRKDCTLITTPSWNFLTTL